MAADASELSEDATVLIIAARMPARGEPVVKAAAKPQAAPSTMRMTAKVTSPNQPGDMTITMLLKRPNLMRREMTMGDRTMTFGFDTAVTFATDAKNCGSCGFACTLANASSSTG